MATNHKPKQKPQKFTGAAKVTVTALSLISFIGSWNLIARLENKEVQADEAKLPPAPVLPSALITATPWPTIPPLTARPDIPTLVPTLTTFGQTANNSPVPLNLESIQLAPIPTPMPLPTLAPLPALSIPPPPPPPPPLPPQPQVSGQSNQSGGS